MTGLLFSPALPFGVSHFVVLFPLFLLLLLLWVSWWRERGIKGFFPVRLRHPFALGTSVCAYAGVSVLCVFSVYVRFGADSAGESWNNLRWGGSIFKFWLADYYPIQICTIPKWYYTFSCTGAVYPFKWTFISHVLKQRPWKCTIQRCLPGTEGFYSSGL